MPLFPMAKSRFLVVAFLCALLPALPVSAACTNPDGEPGEIMYNDSYAVFQGCTMRGWQSFHAPKLPPPPPEGCDNIGQTCTGANAGMIYAGEYNGHKLYVTNEDAPGTVETGGTGIGTYTWNNGNAGERPDLDDAFMPNCSMLAAPRNGNRYSDQSNPACMGAQGPAFTEYLATSGEVGSPYNAALYCYNLGKVSDPMGPDNPRAHGRSDWYLPAVDELEFIYDNLGPAGNHGFNNAYYLSSTEMSALEKWTHFFISGQPIEQYYDGKTSARRVRCVSR